MAHNQTVAHEQVRPVGDLSIGLAGGDPEDDLGAIRVLLGGGTGSDAALELGALRHCEFDATMTRFGHEDSTQVVFDSNRPRVASIPTLHQPAGRGTTSSRRSRCRIDRLNANWVHRSILILGLTFT
jgi:hypothetical protein